MPVSAEVAPATLGRELTGPALFPGFLSLYSGRPLDRGHAMDLLDELLEAWRYTREGVVAEALNLPSDRFNERPPGLQRSPLDLVNHIVESGWLMAGELTRPDGDFQRKPYDALLAEHTPRADHSRDRDAAIEALRRSHAQGEAKIRTAGLEAMMKPIRQFNGVPASRVSWMHHGVSHEEYHRGQLALYARLLGEVPALTKLILGADG